MWARLLSHPSIHPLSFLLLINSNNPSELVSCSKGCHRCVVIYEKHKNVLQYKESECQDMYMDAYQSNPAAMPMRSILKSTEHNSRGAHPNMNGHSRLSSSDQFLLQSNDDSSDCKHLFQQFFIIIVILILFLFSFLSNFFCSSFHYLSFHFVPFYISVIPELFYYMFSLISLNCYY